VAVILALLVALLGACTKKHRVVIQFGEEPKQVFYLNDVQYREFLMSDTEPDHELIVEEGRPK